jgi:hypothetical protein
MTTPRRIVGATALSVSVAAVLLVVAVLPAEYGIDPLGTGRRLGLLDLFAADEPAPPPPPPSDAPPPTIYKSESTQFTLRGSQAFEYKYRLARDRGMVFAWKATGPLKYEFHGEPDDHLLKVKSYDKSEGDHGAGSLMAPFDGIHGWYWENPGDTEVTITLTSAGFYDVGDEMRPRLDEVKHKRYIEHIPHELTPVALSDSPKQ